MADCGTITISCPEITCEADLQVAWTAMCTEVQSAIDQLKACIESYELPECDITVMKDDLVEDPLDCNMVDFTGIVYAAAAGVCQLPYPSEGVVFRKGTGMTALPMGETYGWQSVAIVFATPFPTGCYAPVVQITSVGTVSHLGVQVGMFYAPIIQDDSITANGFTVWFKSDEFAGSDYVYFRYFASGY